MRLTPLILATLVINFVAVNRSEAQLRFAADSHSKSQRSRADIPSANDALPVYTNNRRARAADQLALAGSWHLLLPAGVRKEVMLVAAGTNDYVLQPPNMVVAGRYRVVDGFLVSVSSPPDAPTPESYFWRIRSAFMLVLEKQTGGIGADYTSATLFRAREPGGAETDSG